MKGINYNFIGYVSFRIDCSFTDDEVDRDIPTYIVPNSTGISRLETELQEYLGESYSVSEVDADDETFIYLGKDTALYRLYYNERQIIDALIQAIRTNLLTRPNITPQQIAGIGNLLFGLERMPRVTPGLHVLISLINHRSDGSGSSSMELKLDSDSLRLDRGGYENGPMGGDSYGSIAFEAGNGWRGDCWSIDEVLDWVSLFGGNAKDLSCELTVSSEETEPNWSITDDENDDYYWQQLSEKP